METVAFIDIPGNRCHWIATDTGDEVAAPCGVARSSVNVRRVEAFVDGPIIPGCRGCAAKGQPHAIRRSLPKVFRMSVAEFEEACDGYEGFCASCGAVTNSGVEPDARRLACESCGAETVYGMEEALVMGFVTIH